MNSICIKETVLALIGVQYDCFQPDVLFAVIMEAADGQLTMLLYI